MAVINTILPFPYLLYEKSGWRGIPLDVLVVRGTFHLGSDGIPMHLAAIQTPLQLGDNFDGPIADDPMGAVLKDDGDIVVGKMRTDVILSGHVYSPDAKPLKDWIAAVRIGALRKGLRVSGPRTFKRTLFGWKISRATPVTSVALDYRLAFGGRVQLPAPGRGNDLHFAANPAGIGWLPTSADMKDLSWSEKRKVRAWVKSQQTLPAPQFEDHAKPIRKPSDRPQPQGFGAIARWWQPRVKYQGTLDAKWEAERYPDPPDDYDVRYNQSAHPELISAKLLQGDEEVILAQCLPEGKVVTALPGIAVQAMTRFANGVRLIMPLALDTVRINLDERTCVVIWRTMFDRSNPPVEIDITAMPLEIWQAAASLKKGNDNGGK